jgi:curli biogenesis system outer membrane secretion channel CsgG
MTNALKHLMLGAMLATTVCSAQFATAAQPAKVAVTDLAYEERVQEYFRNISASSRSSLKASARESERAAEYSDLNRDAASYGRRSSAAVDARAESHYSYEEGTYSYIDRGELRKFTGDIKGEMLKSGYFRVVQGKPFTAKNTEKLYDIIARIRQGNYPGADYVLFGTISSIQFRQEANPIDHTDTVSHTLSLELVADFSLISTKNYEVKASFSATGTGQDVKLMSSAGGTIVLNRGKVISNVSKSLGEDVISQLEEQLAGIEGYVPEGRERTEHHHQQQEEVIIFR